MRHFHVPCVECCKTRLAEYADFPEHFSPSGKAFQTEQEAQNHANTENLYLDPISRRLGCTYKVFSCVQTFCLGTRSATRH